MFMMMKGFLQEFFVLFDIFSGRINNFLISKMHISGLSGEKRFKEEEIYIYTAKSTTLLKEFLHII